MNDNKDINQDEDIDDETEDDETEDDETVTDNINKRGRSKVEKTVKTGISFGCALAMVISYTNWHSIGWAVIHGLMSWVYVIYYLLRYN